MLTDLALAAFTGVLAASLLRRGWAQGDWGVAAWGGAFATTAAAALLGGVVHGFQQRLGATRTRPLWKTALLLAALTSFLLLAGVVAAAVEPPARGVLLALAALKLAAAVALLLRRSEFRYVVYDSAASFAGVLALQAHAALRGSAPGAGWIVAGVLLSLVAAGVQRSGLALHRHFNHNDLYHVIQMGAAYLLYRGGLLL